MKELTNIYKEAGQQFVNDLFKDYLLVSEKLAGSSFSFERHGGELRFFKGSNKQPINKRFTRILEILFSIFYK
jgi:hypothetical protein